MKQAFTFAFALLCYNMLTAATQVVGNFTLTYTITDGKATITNCSDASGVSGALTLPDTLGEAPVTTIEASAFESRSSLTSVTIPDSVTMIGDRAFFYCSNLKSIIIPDSVTTIGEHAFYYCFRLTSVTIPDSVTSISYDAFSGCTSLTAIDVHTNNVHYSSIDGILFNKDKTTLVCYPAGKIETMYAILDSVTTIGNEAFRDCSSLTSMTIPNSVITIGNKAFSNCDSLTSVTIPDSVTTIGDEAFTNCGSLITAIDVHANNAHYTSIDGVLFNKDKTTLLCYPANKTNTTYTIPDSVTTIGDEAFSYCNNLTSVTFPDSVTTIKSTFFNCTGLTSVTIGNSVTTIGKSMFLHCRSLTSIVVHTSNAHYTSIDGILFNKDKTTLVYYPAGKTDTTYTIPNSVTSIDESAFYWCRLKSLTIPDSVTTIDTSMFSRSLTSVIFEGNKPTIDRCSYVACSRTRGIGYFYADATGWTDGECIGNLTMRLYDDALIIK